MVFFEINKYNLPTIFGIEGDKPRVVCDFADAEMSAKVKDDIFVRGKFVHRVRTARHEEPHKVRTVLDLVPNKNYDLQQVFIKDENVFIIIVNDTETKYTPFSTD